MASKVRCPQCGGTMVPIALGPMQDKHLKCSYCGTLVDVPDEYETSEAHEEVLGDGSVRRVQTTHRRRDLGGAGSAAVEPVVLAPQQLLRMAGGVPEMEHTAELSFEHFEAKGMHHVRMLDAAQVVDEAVFDNQAAADQWMHEKLQSLPMLGEGAALLGLPGRGFLRGDGGFQGSGKAEQVELVSEIVTTHQLGDGITVPQGPSPDSSARPPREFGRVVASRKRRPGPKQDGVVLFKWIFLCLLALIALMVVWRL